MDLPTQLLATTAAVTAAPGSPSGNDATVMMIDAPAANMTLTLTVPFRAADANALAAPGGIQLPVAAAAAPAAAAGLSESPTVNTATMTNFPLQPLSPDTAMDVTAVAAATATATQRHLPCCTDTLAEYSNLAWRGLSAGRFTRHLLEKRETCLKDMEAASLTGVLKTGRDKAVAKVAAEVAAEAAAPFAAEAKKEKASAWLTAAAAKAATAEAKKAEMAAKLVALTDRQITDAVKNLAKYPKKRERYILNLCRTYKQWKDLPPDERNCVYCRKTEGVRGHLHGLIFDKTNLKKLKEDKELRDLVFEGAMCTCCNGLGRGFSMGQLTAMDKQEVQLLKKEKGRLEKEIQGFDKFFSQFFNRKDDEIAAAVKVEKEKIELGVMSGLSCQGLALAAKGKKGDAIIGRNGPEGRRKHWTLEEEVFIVEHYMGKGNRLGKLINGDSFSSFSKVSTLHGVIKKKPDMPSSLKSCSATQMQNKFKTELKWFRKFGVWKKKAEAEIVVDDGESDSESTKEAEPRAAFGTVEQLIGILVTNEAKLAIVRVRIEFKQAQLALRTPKIDELIKRGVVQKALREVSAKEAAEIGTYSLVWRRLRKPQKPKGLLSDGNDEEDEQAEDDQAEGEQAEGEEGEEGENKKADEQDDEQDDDEEEGDMIVDDEEYSEEESFSLGGDEDEDEGAGGEEGEESGDEDDEVMPAPWKRRALTSVDDSPRKRKMPSVGDGLIVPWGRTRHEGKVAEVDVTENDELGFLLDWDDGDSSSFVPLTEDWRNK